MSDIRINKIQNIPTQKTEKKAQEEKPEQQIAKAPEITPKKADDVLNYMAQSGALNKSGITSKEIDVTKHVNNESAGRIEKMMQSFEETILKSAEIAIKEFGLPEKQGQDVAIMAFNQKFLV